MQPSETRQTQTAGGVPGSMCQCSTVKASSTRNHIRPRLKTEISSSAIFDGKKKVQQFNVRKKHLHGCSNFDLSYLHATSGGSSPPYSDHSLMFNQNSSNSSTSTPSSNASNPSPNLPRSQPRIQVSSLLVDPNARTYHLEVVQHPQKGAEFRNAPLSRLPVTPPIIAKLVIRDTWGNVRDPPEAELPFLIAHLSLFSENGETRLDSDPNSVTPQRILYGNLVSSVDRLEDLQGNTGLFFLFPDVSIRWRGRFQLGITLLRISSYSPDEHGVWRIAQQGTVLAETRSRPFDVVAYNQYIAVPHTRLTLNFMRQGARIFTYMNHPTQP